MDEIKSRVDAIPTFPDNTEKPVVSRTRFQQRVLILTVYGDVPEQTLKEYAKQTRNEVVALPGVSKAQVLGSRDYEISIEVSEHTLQSYDLTLAEVASAIRRGSLDLPAGAIRSAAGDIQVRTKGQAYVGRDFEDIVIRINSDGSRLLLKQIADIRMVSWMWAGFRSSMANRRFPSKCSRPAWKVSSIFPPRSENGWMSGRRTFLPGSMLPIGQTLPTTCRADWT